jgi:alkanesulfonate monooxygenase SsuD/methylene tetrahydromethanopterin reductase-like flavin-dependent oxidoreductase (luciferase family)
MKQHPANPISAHLLLQPLPEPGANDHDLSWIHRAVHAAEAGLFDAVLAPAPGPAVRAEPSTLLAALAATTTNIGLIAPVSAQYVAPYNQARMLNTLDNLSVGRAGWRLITTAVEDSAPQVHPSTTPESQRFARAAEFSAVLRELWESWAPDAVVADAESGVYVDSTRLHPINHAGEFFRVAGPLNLPRSPQLHPPLLIRVDSTETAEFAQEHADIAVIGGSDTRDRTAGVAVVLRELAPDLADPSRLADELAAAVSAGNIDGYVLRLTAADTERFVAELLPRLRDHGVLRERYETSTLRGHLGLNAVPAGAL